MLPPTVLAKLFALPWFKFVVFFVTWVSMGTGLAPLLSASGHIDAAHWVALVVAAAGQLAQLFAASASHSVTVESTAHIDQAVQRVQAVVAEKAAAA
jgi:hypothetical protein